jgi:hypothetical protein
MFRYSLAIALTLSSMQGLAEDWQDIATTKLGLLRVDRASISKDGKYTKAIVNYEFDDLQKIAMPPYKVFNRRQDDVLVDCRGRKLGAIGRRFYKDGELVSSHELSMNGVKFVTSTPDSMAEKVIDAVCQAGTKSN